MYGKKLYELYASRDRGIDSRRWQDLFFRLSFSFIFPYFLKLYSTKAFFPFHPEHHLFLSRNRHSRSQLPKYSVCLSFNDVALTFKSIKMSKCRGEVLTKKLTKLEKKKKMNQKKPDQIRSTMASVGTELRRVTRDVKSAS